MSNADDSWEKFLNPAVLKQNLIRASVFLTAYEMLVDALVDQLRGFYSHTFTSEQEWAVTAEYREHVLKLHKKEVVACAMWFNQSGAISDEDLALLREVIDHRNTVAHRLPKLLASSEADVSLLHLRGIYYLTSKVDRWWIANVEVPTNPDFDASSPTAEELEQAFSIRMVSMSLLLGVAEGDDGAITNAYKQWQAAKEARRNADGKNT